MDDQLRVRRHIEEHDVLSRLFLEDKVSFERTRQQLLAEQIESSRVEDVGRLRAMQKLIEKYFPG